MTGDRALRRGNSKHKRSLSERRQLGAWRKQEEAAGPSREKAQLSRGWGRRCDTLLCVPWGLQGSERGAGQHRPSFCCRKIRMS